MKIVIIGGTGRIGSKLVDALRADGHDPVAAAPRTGVDAYTGDGLTEAQVVVDVANAPVWEDAAVLDFFETSSRNLLAAEAAAGVGHHVALTIVGADREGGSGYLTAKVAQEAVIRAGEIPYTILRATQFFEFVAQIADASTVDGVVRLTPAKLQPVAADDVVALLTEIAEGAPAGDIIELAGPDAVGLDELARRVLAAHDDPREVVADAAAGSFGAQIDDRSLTAGEHTRIAPTRLADWLAAG